MRADEHTAGAARPDAASETRHEVLVGLRVTDEASYARYRAAMTPLLAAAGGFFRCDFRVGEQLAPPSAAPLNRVFVISFPDARARAAFFADPRYLAARREHFEPAVARVEELASFEREA